MSETVFRKANATPAEEETDKTVTKTEPKIKSEAVVPSSTSPVEVPITIFKQMNGFPYTAEYFELKPIWDNTDTGLQQPIMMIEDYYTDQVHKGALKDDRAVYRKFVGALEKATGTMDSPGHMKVAKIAAYIKYLKASNSLDIEELINE